MSNTLRTVFRPTRKKLVITAVLAVCLPLLAYSLATQQYGPEWRDAGVSVLAPPAALIGYAAGLPSYALLSLLEVIYCYVLVCLGGWFLAWIGFLQPTRTRIIVTFVLAIPLTLLAAVLLSTPHPTTEAEVLRRIFLPGAEPLWLLANWGLPVWLLFVLAWLLNFLYYYIVVCTFSALFSGAFERKHNPAGSTTR